MSFKISLIADKPVWDSLPVAKITDYPLEPREYKPFAQARVCVSKQSLWVRLWAFEALPTPASRLMARFNFFPELAPETYFSLCARHDGTSDCRVAHGGVETPMAEELLLPCVRRFDAEDLQGIYWGVVFEVPRALLVQLYGTAGEQLFPGRHISGNFYKLDDSDCNRHAGSFYPVTDFTSPEAFAPCSFGDFELVDY